MNYPLYNNTLCPAVWDQTGEDYQLKDDVRKALLAIAEDFIEKNVTENDLSLTIKDVILIGSITNFNWTPYSDFDMHVIVDFTELDMSPEDAKVLVDGLKSSWNKEHAITIKGHPVELYIQDITEKAVSMSSYSVKNGEWIKKPTKQKPTFDKEFIKRKHSQIKSKLDDMLKNPSEEKLEAMLERIYDMRQAGLDKKGEFSEENIVFKILRSQGYLDRIRDAVRRVYDAERSLDEVEKIDDAIKSPDGKRVVRTTDGQHWGIGGRHYDLVPTDDDSENRVWSFRGMTVFGAYRIMPTTVKAIRSRYPNYDITGDATSVRKAVKNPQDSKSVQIVDDLIDQSVDRMFKQTDVKNVTVIIPLGSSSGLNKRVASSIASKLNGQAVILEDFIQKTTWKDVQLSAAWHREMEYEKTGGKFKGPGIRKHARAAQATLLRNREENPDKVFQVSQLPMSQRRYFSSFYTTDAGKRIDAIKVIRGASILLIDDTMEMGATVDAAKDALEPFQPKDVMIYIFLYGRGSGV